jgi:hypothetical protein
MTYPDSPAEDLICKCGRHLPCRHCFRGPGPEPKFPSREAYLEWCAEQCQKIKTSCIAMNNEGIKETVGEIDQKLYLTDHQELHA